MKLLCNVCVYAIAEASVIQPSQCWGGCVQLYNDNVWHIPALEQWLAIPEKEQMRATPLTPVQEAAAEEFYFFAYVRWLAMHPLKQHLASIPMVRSLHYCSTLGDTRLGSQWLHSVAVCPVARVRRGHGHVHHMKDCTCYCSQSFA